ncbi:hypothetical protein OKW43_007959 [Paraburkholderia sp. WC7.3g]
MRSWHRPDNTASPSRLAGPERTMTLLQTKPIDVLEAQAAQTEEELQ